ncbi:hypothetical protein LTR60_006734, partial [Cryomyces antarcticus]
RRRDGRRGAEPTQDSPASHQAHLLPHLCLLRALGPPPGDERALQQQAVGLRSRQIQQRIRVSLRRRHLAGRHQNAPRLHQRLHPDLRLLGLELGPVHRLAHDARPSDQRPSARLPGPHRRARRARLRPWPLGLLLLPRLHERGRRRQSRLLLLRQPRHHLRPADLDQHPGLAHRLPPRTARPEGAGQRDALPRPAGRLGQLRRAVLLHPDRAHEELQRLRAEPHDVRRLRLQELHHGLSGHSAVPGHDRRVQGGAEDQGRQGRRGGPVDGQGGDRSRRGVVDRQGGGEEGRDEGPW